MEVLKRIWDILSKPPELQPELLGFISEPLSDLVDGNIMKFIYQSVTGLIRFFQQIVLTSPTVLMRSNQFWNVYKIITFLGIAVLAVSIAIASLQKVKDGVSMEPVMFKVLAFAPIAAIGPHVIIKVIEVFNRAASLIITADVIVVPDRVTAGGLLGHVLIIVGIAILSAKLLYYYAVRNAGLIVITILLPVIAALWCIPIYDDLFNKYIKILLKPLKTQVFHAVVLLVLGSIIMEASTINNLMALFLQIGCLGLMNKAESVISELLDTERLTPVSWTGEIKKRNRQYQKAKQGKNLVKSAIKYFRGGI